LAKGHVLLGTPNDNIHRDPLNVRLFEGYSEGPCLVAGLAPAFVKGIQDRGVVANAKHFAANNEDRSRRLLWPEEQAPDRVGRGQRARLVRRCLSGDARSRSLRYPQPPTPPNEAGGAWKMPAAAR